jgi:hypothetical protein
MAKKKRKTIKKGPHQLYNNILKELRDTFGNKATTNEQLDDIGREYFGGIYIGTYPWDKYPVQLLPNYHFAIINTDDSTKNGTHWVGIHKRNNNIYVYDSFGRHTKNLLKKFNKKMTGKGYYILDSDYDSEQANYQEDCGLRCICWLLIIKGKGIKYALEI